MSPLGPRHPGVHLGHLWRIFDALGIAFPESDVDGYEESIHLLKNDSKDRHVLAAALKAKPTTLVTWNVRHFPPETTQGLRVATPDDVLLELLANQPGAVLRVVRQQATSLRRPPLTILQFLEGLSRTVPRFTSAAREALTVRPVED